MISEPISDAGRSRLRKVVVVFKTHFDLGFTGLPDEVMATYTGPIFESVRQVMESTTAEQVGPRFSWTLPAWPMKYLLHDPGVPEETRAAARRLVEEGRLHWHAWPFTTHTAFCGLEELVRGLHISRALSEEFGIWPTAAKQTDVPGHTWIYPSLLVKAGIKFLHLGCNSGSHPPHVPRLFWWEGPDGARLLTYYSVGGYGTPLLPPDDWPFDTWLALQHTLDNAGPQTSEELQGIHSTISEAAPNAEIIFGRLDDFASALFERPEQLESLPVVPYDLADTWIHGVGTMPREVARVRELRTKLLEIESIAAAFSSPDTTLGRKAGELDFGLARQVAPYIDEAYEQLLLFGEHTWGLDVKSTIQRVFGPQFEAARETEAYKRLESSWMAKAEYVNRAERAYTHAREIVRKEWRNWLESPEVQERRALRQELFGDSSIDLDSIEDPQKRLLFEPPDLSYAAAPTSPTVIEDRNLRIEVDPTLGGVISLQDESGREWVDRTQGEPFGGYRYDIYSAADIAEFMRAYGLLFQDWFVNDFGKIGYPEHTPHVTAYAGDFELSREPDDYGAESFLLTGGTLKAVGSGVELLPPQKISIRITPWAAARAATIFDYKIEDKGATPFAESTMATFPLKLPKAAFKLGQVGSVIDPGRDIIEGANRNLWCADWVDASNDTIGMAVIPHTIPLVSIGDTGIYMFAPNRAPIKPIIYAHLSNTQWGTNFPQWLEGSFDFGVTLMPHWGDWRAGRIWEQTPHGWIRDLRPEGETKGVTDLPFELPDGVLLQAVRPNHSGPGLIVRYYDALGTPRREVVKIWGPVESVWRCDLMERPIEKLRLSMPRSEDSNPHTSVLVTIARHAIETLLIEFKQP